MDNFLLKKDAREKLKGNYIEIISAMILIYSIAIFVVSIGNILENKIFIALISLIISSFVLMGFISMIMKITKKEETHLDDLFSKIHWVLKTFLLISALVIIIGIFAFFLVVALFGLYNSSGLWGICADWIVVLLICIGIILSLALLMFTSYVALSFSLVFFIYHDEPTLSIYDILKRSYNMMDGHKLELFVLIFSFIGWIILSMFTFGLLCIWLAPYMLVTFANFYNSLLPKKKRGRPAKKKKEKVE